MIYPFLLSLHSPVRWLVLASLVFSLFRAFTGLRRRRVFSKTDNAIRHWTATIAHIQLMLGIWLYCISPIVAYFLPTSKQQYTSVIRVFSAWNTVL